MKSLDSGSIAALESGHYAVRALVLFDLPGGRFGMFDDEYNLAYGGDTYVGAAGRFTLSLPPTAADQSVRGLTVTISGLDSSALAWVQSAEYHQRPMFALLAFIATDTPQIIAVKRWFGGFIDQVTWREGIGGQSQLIVQCESYSRDNDRAGARTRTDADQKARESTDGFFKMTVSAIATEIEWGATQPEAPAKSNKKWWQRIF